MADYILADMAVKPDQQDYGNKKGKYIDHLLVKLLHKILTAVDNNPAKDKYTVVLKLSWD